MFAALSSPSLCRFSKRWLATPRPATGEGNSKQLQGIDPPMIRLRAQDHRVFFRDKGDCLQISRVLHRKEAYRLRRPPNKARKNAGQELDKDRMKPGQAPNARSPGPPLVLSVSAALLCTPFGAPASARRN